MTYYKKITILLCIVMTMALSIQMTRMNLGASYTETSSRVVKNSTPVNAMKTRAMSTSQMLLIYDETSDSEADEHIAQALDYMKISYDKTDVTMLNQLNYDDYEMVILMVGELETKVGSELYRLMDYVNQGGKFLLGAVPEEVGDTFEEIAPQLGIKEVGSYLTIDGMKFNEEVLPTSSGLILQGQEVFEDVGLKYLLDEKAKVYIESYGSVKENPILWERELGQGKVVIYNGGALGYGYSGGLVAGIISNAMEDFMYPIINAKVIFIDDFPSQQYNGENPIVAGNYNRNAKEFYRDIWWPDMQKVANQYGYLYTGMFIATYNNIVNPEEFVFETDKMMQYYGNSLLKGGHEIGLHGYNHQSLVSEGYLPDEVGYNAWASREDMIASIRALVEYMKQLYPNGHFRTYVPPSNFLNEEGRKALKEAVPDLKIISGIYTAPEEDVYSYVQEFEVAEDGVVEFPRMTSGMWYEDETIFQYLNGLGLHGVFSHFIHPDDISDEERGRGEPWEVLLEGYTKILEDVDKRFEPIRALKAVEAADAVEVYEALDVEVHYGEDLIEGMCNDFYGEAFFYLRTQKKPVAIDESCEISTISSQYSGKYYVVKVKEPTFRIKLVG